jgi:hypothetical protein
LSGVLSLLSPLPWLSPVIDAVLTPRLDGGAAEGGSAEIVLDAGAEASATGAGAEPVLVTGARTSPDGGGCSIT